MRTSQTRWSPWMLALSIALLLPAGASAASEACPHARYQVDGDPAVTGLELGGVVALGDVCDPVAPKRWKARKNGTTLVAARWRQCDGLSGAVRLQGKLVDGCRRFRGV